MKCPVKECKNELLPNKRKRYAGVFYCIRCYSRLRSRDLALLRIKREEELSKLDFTDLMIEIGEIESLERWRKK